jgi:perosamine synthetase
MLVTDDKRVATYACAARNHGRVDLDYLRVGYNYRMDEMSAALGLARMSRLDEMLEKRRQVADWYDGLLNPANGLHIQLPPGAAADRSWFAYVVQVQNRDMVMADLAEAGIETGIYFPNISLMAHVVNRSVDMRMHPMSFVAHGCTLALPFHTKLTRTDVEYVCTELGKALQSC